METIETKIDIVSCVPMDEAIEMMIDNVTICNCKNGAHVQCHCRVSHG